MPRGAVALALVVGAGLLLTAPCRASPAIDVAATWVGNHSNGSRPASSSLRASAAAWPFLPDAFTYYVRWAPSLALMDVRVRVGTWRSDSDPLWQEAADLIKNAAYASAPGRRFMDLCSAGKLEEYSQGACASDTLGNVPVWGIPADAYFCGSTKSGINWARPWWGGFSPPVKNVCEARPGTAYDATGICGRWSTKELVISFFYVVPLWGIDPVTINGPSLHCLMGLGNCDIYYCQHCPGRCGPA